MPKKHDFVVKIFKKVPENDFFGPILEKICLLRRKIGQNRVFIVFIVI